MVLALVAVAAAQQASVPVPPDLAADPNRVDVFADRSTILPSATSFSGYRSTLAVVHVRDPLVFRPADGGESVAIVGPVWGLVGALAAARGPFAVGVSLPVYATVGSDLTDDAPGSALGDVALDARFLGLDAAGPGGIGLAVQGRVTAPLGADAAYLGQPGPTWELLATGAVHLADTRLTAALGTRGVPEVELEGAALDDLLVYRLGVGQDLGPGGATLELVGQRQYQGFLDDPTNSPLEVLVGGFRAVSECTRVRGALGVGVNPSIGSPQLRLVLGVGADAAPAAGR